MCYVYFRYQLDQMLTSRHLSEVVDFLNHDPELNNANILRFSFDMNFLGDIHGCLFYEQAELEALEMTTCGNVPPHLPPEMDEVRTWVGSCDRGNDHYSQRKYDISGANFDCHQTKMWWKQPKLGWA